MNGESQTGNAGGRSRPQPFLAGTGNVVYNKSCRTGPLTHGRRGERRRPPMEAKVTFSQGLQFVGRADSGHALVMDGPVRVGGSDSAPRPSELLLLALAGCTGMDVISILRQRGAEGGSPRPLRETRRNLCHPWGGDRSGGCAARHPAVGGEILQRGGNSPRRRGDHQRLRDLPPRRSLNPGLRVRTPSAAQL